MLLLQKLCKMELCKEGLIIAQRTLVATPSLAPNLAQSILTTLSGPDKSTLMNCLCSAANMTAALLRLLASNQVRLIVGCVNSYYSFSYILHKFYIRVCVVTWLYYFVKVKTDINIVFAYFFPRASLYFFLWDSKKCPMMLATL